MVITAVNDQWTGGVFTAGRHLSTLFEGYDESTDQSRVKESNANLRAIGFVDRYRTHRLCLRTVGANTFATISPTLTPASTADPRKVATRTVWVAGAPPNIIDGHNGFLYARKTGTVPDRTCFIGWSRRTSTRPMPSRRRIPAEAGPDVRRPSAGQQ